MKLELARGRNPRAQVLLSLGLLVAGLMGLAGMINTIELSELSTFRVELAGY